MTFRNFYISFSKSVKKWNITVLLVYAFAFAEKLFSFICIMAKAEKAIRYTIFALSLAKTEESSFHWGEASQLLQLPYADPKLCFLLGYCLRLVFKPSSGTEPLIQRRTPVSNPLTCLLSTIFSVTMFLLKLSVAVLSQVAKIRWLTCSV